MSGNKHALNPTPTSFVIARMTEHDLLEVVEIEEGAGLSRWGWDAYQQELLCPERAILLVARECGMGEGTGSVIGFVATRLNGDEFHINNIAVRPEYRSEGAGGALFDAVLKEGILRGAKLALLEVRVSNLQAMQLYLSRGFVSAGVRRHYYSDPREDAVVMKLELKGSA